LLTGCDYDPSLCEQGPSWTGSAVVIIAVVLGLAIAWEVGKSIWENYRERSKNRYPDSWLD